MPPAESSTTTAVKPLESQSVALARSSRCNLATLWTVAGFEGNQSRVARFLVALIRPPLVSNTDPTVVCELLAPIRTRLGASIVLTASATLIAVAAGLIMVLPEWLSVALIAAASLSAVVLVERACATFSVPPHHLRLQGLAAERRGSGVGDAVLEELFRSVHRPTVLSVRRDAPGVIALYERVGFTTTSAHSSDGTITMTRPAPDGSTADKGPLIAGIRPSWLWPTPRDIAGGLVATVALMGLHASGTWSRLVVVAVAAFVTVTSAGTDWRLHRIPTKLSVAGALPIIWIATTTDNTVNALAGAALMSGPLLASHVATRGRAPGLGDVKLALLVGAALALLSPTTAPLAAIMLTLICGAVFGALYQRRRLQRGFPLGPAIAAATITILTVDALTLRGVL